MIIDPNHSYIIHNKYSLSERKRICFTFKELIESVHSLKEYVVAVKLSKNHYQMLGF